MSWEQQNSQTRFDKLVEKESLLLNDSLPHYQYKKQQDSIRRRLSEENFRVGSSMKVLDVGIEKSQIEKNELRYCVTVGGYFAKDYLAFYSLHGKNYLEYDSAVKTGDPQVQSIETKKIETKLGIEQLDREEWQIHYPVSKTTYTIWQAVIILLNCFAIGLLLFGITFLFIRLLFLIAKGKAFSDEVLRLFYTGAGIFFLAGFIKSGLLIGLHLYYKTQMPYPVTFYFYDDIMSGVKFIIIGLITLLFAKAFQRGRELQQEQDLTV